MNNLKKLRIERKLTQEQVADIINMSNTNYAKIERNEVNLNSEHIRILCKFYDVSSDYLLGIKNSEIEIISELKEYIIKLENILDKIEK